MPPKHTVTFIQLSHTYTRARTHTWFFGAAPGARHLLSHLDSCTFSTLPVPAARTRGVLSWAATPPHLCITTPKSTRRRHPPKHTPALPFNTPLLHPSWTLTHRRLPAQQEIVLQFEKSRMELWCVTRCSWTAGSRDRRWSGVGGGGCHRDDVAVTSEEFR